MKCFFSLILSFLFCLSSVAALYTPTTEVISAPFADSGVIDDSGRDFVYSVALEGHPHVTVTLSGANGYAPKLYLFDPVLDDFIFQENGAVGDVISYTYTPGLVNTKPQEIYAVVINFGNPGATYNLEVTAQQQNDAGTGMDAPKRFSDGLLIIPGEYQGFLGGGDLADQYSLRMVQGETVSFKITPADKTSVTFKLVDNTLFTKVDTSAMLEVGASLTAQYMAKEDQTVYFGLESNQPYTLLVESSNEVRVPHPVLPEPVVVVPEPTPSPPPLPPVPELVEEDDSRSIGMLLMIIAIVLLVVLGVVMYSQKQKASQPQKKKSEPKKKQ